MAANVPEYVIVLAAGKGSRMGSNSTHKVCFEIDGVPAIVRALDVYRQCGVTQNLVVVGQLAGQVVETVGKAFPNTVFAYQKEANGTANAVRSALEAMPSMPDDADILVVAGDRLIDPTAVERLFDLYYSEKCDLAMLSLPTRPGSGAGRIVTDAAGNAAAILEMADVRKKRTLARLRKEMPKSREAARAVMMESFSTSESKCFRAFGERWDNSADYSRISDNECVFEVAMPDGSQLVLTPDEVENLPNSNTSVYIIGKRALSGVLANLSRDNAQKEEYLSDVAAVLRRNKPNANIRILTISDPARVLGFNNPQELLEVSEIVRNRARRTAPEPDKTLFLPVGEYLAKIERALAGDFDSALLTELKLLYGDDAEWIKKHLSNYLPLLTMAAARLAPETPVAVVRSPGRVNVMGRHVDHQGGNCNLMTINFETLMVIAPRRDDVIRLEHLDPQFKPCEFTISQLVRELPWDDWTSLVNSRKLHELIGSYGVDWSHYVKAAALRLQKKFSHQTLFGMDMFVAGNVPMAAGLSSSSSLVVGAAEAVVAVNALDTFPSQLVTLCGEGEWFVGTRGGAADHAAVKLGEENRVVKVKFFDFGVVESVPFPEECVMVLCDSGIQARKAGGARDQFNHRVSCYRLGFELLKKQFPQYAPLLSHLRDVNCETLGVSPERIYRMLLHLPETATRSELESLLTRDLGALWSTHNAPADGLYPVRSVVLYGLSECARSSIYAEKLKKHDLPAIGELMRISHDGDRVARRQPDGSMTPWRARCDNAFLLDLIDDLASGDPRRVTAAQLEKQSGSYACSLPEIDAMVDIVSTVDGVIGAQLAGAGLGGCMMVLARKQAVEALSEALISKYYSPHGLPDRILVCRPIAGSGVLKIN
ncbi:MAG: NTP transferase domain-containing protein [Victivallaceae bacterium]|nr:NTP transferase domain-containing protein [Victivallaceae bacterium]